MAIKITPMDGAKIAISESGDVYVEGWEIEASDVSGPDIFRGVMDYMRDLAERQFEQGRPLSGGGRTHVHVRDKLTWPPSDAEA